MTRYTVTWDKGVEADFLDSWVKSDTSARAFLTEVANTIDQSLAFGAEAKGEKQSDEITRALIVEIGAAEITAFFEVVEADRRVLIRRLVFRYRMEPR
jgi:hypothetical protein